MAWAAWRAGLIGWWGPALVTTLVLAHELLPDPSSGVDVVSMAILAVIFGHLGLRILRMTDNQWSGSSRGDVQIPAHA